MTSQLAPPIVVADDDPVARLLVVSYFAKLRLRNPVMQVASGAEAREAIAGARRPALVLLDVHMQGESGLEVLRWMRSVPAYLDIPVIMLTGSTKRAELDEAHALGISVYLVKPVGFAGLKDVLHQISLPWALLGPDDTSPSSV